MAETIVSVVVKALGGNKLDNLQKKLNATKNSVSELQESIKRQGAANSLLKQKLTALTSVYSKVQAQQKKLASTPATNPKAKFQLEQQTQRLKELKQEIDKTKASLRKGLTLNIQGKRNLDILQKELRETQAELNKTATTARKAQSSISRSLSRIGNSKIAKGIAAGGALGGLPGAGIFQSVGGGALVGGPKGAVAAGLVAIGSAAVQAGGDAARFAAEVSKLETALRNVAGADTPQALAAIRRDVDELNTPIKDATQNFTGLLAATSATGLTVEETAKVYRGLSSANKALGGDAEKLNGILLAAQQVFSKGKVSAEELRGQIGERLPGAFALFAQATGKTTAELDKALQNGEVSLDDFVKFTEKLFQKYGEDAKIIASGPEEAGARLQTALSDLQRNVGTLLGPIGAAFQETFTQIVKFINAGIVALNNFLGIGLEGAVNKAQREVDSALNGFSRFEDVNRDELDQRGKAAFDRAKRRLDLSSERLEKAKSALAGAAKGEEASLPDVTTPTTTTTAATPRGGGGGSSAGDQLAREAQRMAEAMRQQLEASKRLKDDASNRLLILQETTKLEKIQAEGEVERFNIQRDFKKKLSESLSVEETINLKQAEDLKLRISKREEEEKIKALRDGALASINEEIALQNAILAGKEEEFRREKAIQDLIKAGGGTVGREEAARRVDQRNAGLKLVEQTKQLDDLYKGIGDTIQNGIISAIDAGIDGLINGTKELGDALKEIASGVLKQIGNALLSFGLNSALSGLGGNNVGLFSRLFPKAEGGPVSPDKTFLVGEKGPEIFVPNTSGTIIPNDEAFNDARNALIDTPARPANEEAEAFAVAAGALARNSQVINNRQTTTQQETSFNNFTEAMMRPGQSTVRFETVRVGDMDMVTRDEALEIGTRSAKAAEANVFNALRNKPSVRRSIGMS